MGNQFVEFLQESLLGENVARNWWSAAGLNPPFTPGFMSGNNDGCVRDSTGAIVANCSGNEARADVIAALLNDAANSADINPSTEGNAQ